MRTGYLFLTLAVIAVVTGASAGFAFANDDYQNAYSPSWFSQSGYGPNDDQANATRDLNNAQLQNGGQVEVDEQGVGDQAIDLSDDAVSGGDDQPSDEGTSPPPAPATN